MPAALIPAVIGAGGALGSSLIGAHSAGEASQDYSNQINQAIQNMNAAQGRARNLYNPYVSLGNAGLKQLMGSGLFSAPTFNTNGSLEANSLGEQFATPFQAPTAQQVADTPGYQFAKAQGADALEGSAAARGNLLSSTEAKGLESYGTGLANQYYQQAYNNALGQYMNNYNIFQNNQNNMYNRLMGATGVGLSGASSLANSEMGGAESIAQMLGAKGAAQGNADLAGGNALAGGLTGATNAFQLALMNQNKSTGSGYGPSSLPVSTLYPAGSMNNLMPNV